MEFHYNILLENVFKFFLNFWNLESFGDIMTSHVILSSHVPLHIWGMLIPFFALPWLYFESLTFKRSNQNGRRRY